MPDLAGIDFFADETLLITFAFAEDFADLYESGDFMVDVFFVGSNILILSKQKVSLSISLEYLLQQH